MKKLVSMTLAICLLLAVCLPVNALTAADFTDIPDNWAKPAIEYCLGKGLMKGAGEGKFNPGGTVNRAQIAQVLYNRENSPSTAGLANPFTDVPGGQWYTDGVIWCKANGVVNGSSDTTFSPTKQVARQDICVMVYRYVTDYKKLAVELTPENTMASTFTDWGKVAKYAKEAVRWANKSGFMKGSSATTLNPTGQATRAELAQFLMNLDKLLENGKPDNPQYTGSYNPNPPAEAFYADNDAGKQYASKTLDEYDRFETAITDEMYNSMLTNGYFTNPAGYELHLPEIEYVPGSVPGKSYQGYVPYKGYVIGGNTYTTTIGSHTYTKATGGSIFNRYGVDVTNVDGVMSSTEAQIARILAQNLTGTVGYDHTNGCNAYFDPALQMAAEYALEEAKENVDNLVHAGLPGSTHKGGWGVAAAEARVSQTRNILEKSKTIDANADYDDGREDLVGYISSLGDGSYFDDDDLHKDTAGAWGNGVHDSRVGYKSQNTHTHLSVAPLFEYFGGEIFYKTYDTNTNAVAAQGPLFCVGSGSFRLSPGTKYTTFVGLCQGIYSNFSDWLDLGSSHGDKLYGVAFDEETNQIYILVAAMANDTPDGINRRTNGNEADINAFYTQG